MKFPNITIHTEISFDSYTFEPDPWWRPFFWYRIGLYKDDDSVWSFVVRIGALGFHLCVAFHYYKELSNDRKS